MTLPTLLLFPKKQLTEIEAEHHIPKGQFLKDWGPEDFPIAIDHVNLTSYKT